MKFYADENFALAVITELRKLGHDVLTAFEDEKANQKIPDDKVLERATELERAVLTINRKDFKKLHETDNNHAGIFSCTFDADFIGQASRINIACQDVATANGQLIKIYRPA
jgi:Domain of unknown function (DUF5615)